jgi:indole-3-glycerol phosphate synthase
MGDAQHLKEAREAVLLPVLRKDFMLEPYQIIQSRALGADCVLLIVAALEDAQMKELAQCAHDLSMDVLVEVHDEAELERALDIEGAILGINNRNLRTFVTDISVTTRLAARVPAGRLIVSESGISSRADLDLLQHAGVHAFLIGETFMRASDPGAALKALVAPSATPD